MTTDEIREKYLAFFESRGHVRVPSAPLVPENDPTTLFTGSGMQPMVPYLLGEPHPQGTRIVDSQKSFRSTDIDEIGDNRHTSFFEMLGNWSLGDYFKKEQIEWIFAFLTQEVGLDPSRLYVTAFRGNKKLGIPKDTETVQLWKEQFNNIGIEAVVVDDPEQNGMGNGRIFYYDDTKNWWSRSGTPDAMPKGEPGGPDTEMFWDYGQSLGMHEASRWADASCHVNCDCGRFMEIGNNVFMEYVKTKTGFDRLPKQNVDFGGGLERIAAARKDNPDIFTIDVFEPAIGQLEQVSSKQYGRHKDTTHAFRVIADHIRAATFLITDGVQPSNKDQGYFVRRLIRRAVRFGASLDIDRNFLANIVPAVTHTYNGAYPDLARHTSAIQNAVDDEESKFRSTLTSGLKVFDKATTSLSSGDTVPAQIVFDLFQSHGFPREMTRELAEEKHLSIDEKAVDALLKRHQQTSRKGSQQKFKGGLIDHSDMSVKYHTATHLLHQALRTVLGNHVEQRGSNITPERLRFDFSHPEKMTPDQVQKVEALITKQINADLPVVRQEMSVNQAKQKGALGLFEHKYEDRVSVYTIGDFSCEICGGPHVERTGTLGTFKITKEESAGKGIRRIKAVLE